MIALHVIVFEKLSRKVLQPFERRMGSALPRFNGSDAAIETLPVARHILMHGVGSESPRPLPRVLGVKILIRMQILRQEAVEPRTNRIRSILRLLYQLRWNDNIGINGPE